MAHSLLYPLCFLPISQMRTPKLREVTCCALVPGEEVGRLDYTQAILSLKLCPDLCQWKGI